jgi:hypothetical protein
MKKFLAVLMLSAMTAVSSRAQGYIFFNNSSANVTKISTNSVIGGAATGLTTATAGKYVYGLFYSTSATSVNGQTAPIAGLASGNYAFNDSNWKFAGYATNISTAGRFSAGVGSSGNGTIIPNVPGGNSVQCVVVGWSASIGMTIGEVVAWYNGGLPISSGLIGQSTVSGALFLGDGAAIPAPQLFGSSAPMIQGFVLGMADGLLYNPAYISSQPTNQTVTFGGTASFQARAYGDASLSFSYQWRFNGTNISAGGNYSMSVSDFNSFGTHYADFTLTVTNAQLTNAGTYSVFVSNAAGSSTSSNALLAVTGSPGVPPGIVNQPANVAALLGNNVSFAVTASGSAPLSYQWKYNGTNIANATNVSLPLLNVQLADAGNFSVTITNAYGVTNSAAGVLTVSPGLPPTITVQPLPQMVQIGNNATFTVGVSGSAPLSYQWKYNGTNLTSGTNAALLLTSVQTNNVGNYSVAISSPFGSTNSLGATLAVFPPSGYVSFLAGVSSATKIFTNSEIGGAPTGQTGTNGANYLYALFASATATNVNGQTTPILGAANNNYAFNDTNWTLVAYGTNTFRAGRLASIYTDSSGATPVAGFAGGSSVQLVVVGWSANIGLNITAVQNWFNNGSVSSDGWIGQSKLSGVIGLGDGGIIPPATIFGATSPLIPGFTLGLASPNVAVHYSAPSVPPLVLQPMLVGNSLKLSWPASAGSYGLQSSGNPSGPWSDTGLSSILEGSNSTVTVPITGQQKFFRLIVQ